MTSAEIATKLMLNIMYDNGWVNRLEPEYIDPRWVQKISPFTEKFFALHPHLLTDEFLDELAAGDLDRIVSEYGMLEGFTELNNVLNEYFESGDKES